MRPVELVGRAGEEVRAERLHVDERVRGVVDGVHEHEGAVRVRHRRDARDVVDRPDGVRRAADGDETGPLPEEPPERVEVEPGLPRGERRRLDDDAAVLLERAPGVDVRVVVEVRDDDFVAAAQPRARARPRWNVSVVMFAPKTISDGSPPRKSARARREDAIIASVSTLVG